MLTSLIYALIVGLVGYLITNAVTTDLRSRNIGYAISVLVAIGVFFGFFGF